MSEMLEGLIRDLSTNKLELAEFINEYFSIQKGLVKQLKERNATIKFAKLKIQDFQNQLVSIGKINDNKMIESDIKATLEDISSTLNALNQF